MSKMTAGYNWDVSFCVEEKQLKESHLLVHRHISPHVFIRLSRMQTQHSLNCPDVINMTLVLKNKGL